MKDVFIVNTVQACSEKQDEVKLLINREKTKCFENIFKHKCPKYDWFKHLKWENLLLFFERYDNK